MKHFMEPRNAILRETTIQSLASPNPSATKPQPSRKRRGSKENAPSPGRRGSRRAPRRLLRCQIRTRCPRFQSTRCDLRRQVEEPAPATTADVDSSQEKAERGEGSYELRNWNMRIWCPGGFMKSLRSKIVAFG